MAKGEQALKPLVPEPADGTTPLDGPVAIEAPLSLYARLAQAMRAVGYIQKKGRNQAQNYSYASEADVAAEVRVALLDAGLVLVPSLKSWERGTRPTKSGQATVTFVVLTYRLVALETGEETSFDMAGEGMDSGDKSCAKAITAAGKYAQLKLLQLATGDDPEADERTDRDAGLPEKLNYEELLQPLLIKAGVTFSEVCDEYKVKALGDLTKQQASEVARRLENAIKDKE